MKESLTPPRSRRNRERDAHRREILEAAERVFAAKGYETATVEEIAREAEFATGTLYNFFDGKEALFLAVADRILDDLVARFDEEIEPIKSDPRTAIPRFVALRLNEISMHEAFLHVFHPVLKARCAKAQEHLPPVPHQGGRPVRGRHPAGSSAQRPPGRPDGRRRGHDPLLCHVLAAPRQCHTLAGRAV